MLRAVGQLVTHRRVVSGASTLTMQTVRLLERRPRTLAAKLVEIAEALGLERRLRQGRHPGDLYDAGAVRRQSRGSASGKPGLFRQGTDPALAGRGGASGRHSALAGAAASRSPSRRRARGSRPGPGPNGRQGHHLRADAGRGARRADPDAPAGSAVSRAASGADIARRRTGCCAAAHDDRSAAAAPARSPVAPRSGLARRKRDPRRDGDREPRSPRPRSRRQCRVRRGGAARYAGHDTGGALARLDAEAVHLRHGI